MDTQLNPSSKLDIFAAAMRAVLTEMEYDDLPVPMRIGPTENGIELQVSQDEFDAWCEVLANSSVAVTAPAHVSLELGGRVVEHVKATGTINNHHVDVIAVRKLEHQVVVVREGEQAVASNG